MRSFRYLKGLHFSFGKQGSCAFLAVHFLFFFSPPFFSQTLMVAYLYQQAGKVLESSNLDDSIDEGFEDFEDDTSVDTEEVVAPVMSSLC